MRTQTKLTIAIIVISCIALLTSLLYTKEFNENSIIKTDNENLRKQKTELQGKYDTLQIKYKSLYKFIWD